MRNKETRNKQRSTEFQSLLFICLILLPIGMARADQDRNQEKTISLTLSAGMETNFRFGTLVPTPQTADVPPIDILLEHAGPTWGLSLDYRICRRFEIQAEFRYGRTRIMNDVGIGLAGIPLGKIKTSDADSYTYGGRLLYYLKTGSSPPMWGWAPAFLRSSQSSSEPKQGRS